MDSEFPIQQTTVCINFKGTLSDVIEINTGTPQGCVLSTVLFIII